MEGVSDRKALNMNEPLQYFIKNRNVKVRLLT